MGIYIKRLFVFGVIVSLGVVLGWGASPHSVQMYGVSALMGCVCIAYAIQWMAAVPAILWNTESFFDLIGSCTYLSMLVWVLFSAWTQDVLTPSKWLISLMVAVWAIRLGLFLWKRTHKAGGDKRFEVFKASKSRFFIVWTLQGLWVFCTALAALIILTSPKSCSLRSPWLWLGGVMWCFGFVIEVIADSQKSTFKALPENRDKWIDVGLWRYSQHPNYWGEILLWTGICICGIPIYKGGQWLAFLSPLFVFVLLYKISGIPILDQRALDKWGDDPKYRLYREQTNVLILGPRKQ